MGSHTAGPSFLLTNVPHFRILSLMNELAFEDIFMAHVISDKAFLASVYSCGIPEETAQYPLRDDNQLLLSKTLDYFGKCGKVPTIEILRVDSDEGEVAIIDKAWNRAKEINGEIDPTVLYSDTTEYLRSRGTNWVIEQAAKGKIEGAEIARKINKAIGITLDKNLGYDIVKDFDQFYKKLNEKHATITTGYNWMDEQLEGGWVCGEPALYVFAGETNVGKSVLLMQFLIAAYKAGKNALMVSLEMSQFMYSKRIYANLCQIGMKDLKYQSDNIRQMISSPDPAYGKIIVKEFPTGTLSVPQLENYLEDLERNDFKPDVIFVDYLNLMTAHSKDKKKYEEIGEIAVGLRGLSYRFAPIVTATQLNREGMGRANPGIEKTAQSIEGSYCADFQASIFQLPEQREMGVINIGIQKTRFGDKGKVKMFGVDFPKMTIHELDQSTEGVMGVPAMAAAKNEASDFEEGLL